jgi:hypothetical protein
MIKDVNNMRIIRGSWLVGCLKIYFQAV